MNAVSAESNGPERDDLRAEAAVGDFVELWLADQRRGQLRPLPDYLARFPGFENRIAREYLRLAEPEPQTEPAAEPQPDASTPTVTPFGIYRPIRLLGQGGQGEVWLAEDTQLGRNVALKILAVPAGGLSTARVERLRREAHALAKIDHPGICPIYDADLTAPRPFLAMRYVEGETLAAILARHDAAPTKATRESTRAAIAQWLPWFARVADALHASHAIGIVHRDIKPGNLMHTPDGAPVVLDFGLADDLESTALSLTRSGEMFGTLPYMAPEVLLGRPADHRVDVYALGVTLFETLTHQRPFVGATHVALRAAIESGTATPLSELLPAIGADLSLVVAIAMERDPARRYLTAKAFADDLRRVSAGEPIAARPLGPGIRLRRLVARHRVLASGVGFLTVGLVVTLLLLARVARGRARLQALTDAYQARAIMATQQSSALDLVIAAAEAEPQPEINDILYEVLDARWEEQSIVDSGAYHMPSPWPATSSDDRLLLEAGIDGRIRLIDTETGATVRTFQHGSGATSAAFLGDHWLLTSGSDGLVCAFDIESGACVRKWTAHAPHTYAVSRLLASPDGRHAATGGADGKVALFSAESPGITRCRGHAHGVSLLAFDPRSTRLATASGGHGKWGPGDGTVQVFDIATGESLLSLAFEGAIHWLDWSRDATRLVLGLDDGAEVRDAASGALLLRLPLRTRVYWAGFTAADQQIATGSGEGLSVFDVANGSLVRRHSDFADRSVIRGAFDPNAARLAVVSWDNTARVYEVATWNQVRKLAGVSNQSTGVAWNRRGTRIITVGGYTQTWFVDDRPFLPVLRGHRDRVNSAEFSPDGERALTASADGDARLWDARTSAGLATYATNGALRRARFGPDGRLVLTVGESTPASLFLGDGKQLVLGPVVAVDGWFLHDGRVLLAGVDGQVRIHDAGSGRLLHAIPCHSGTVTCGALHPTRSLFATGGNDRRVCVVDLQRAEVMYASAPWTPGALGERERVFDVCFDRAGNRLFASCEDKFLMAIDLADRSVARSPWGSTPGRLLMLPDDAGMVSAAQWHLGLRVSSPADLTERQVANLLVNRTSVLEHSPSESLVLNAGTSGVVFLYEPLADRVRASFRASEQPVLDARFSPDGSRIITAAADGLARIWPTDPLDSALRLRRTGKRPSSLFKR